MYNGVGLPTPRGSGTSGYVQKNLAYVSKTTSKMQFQKELEALKANPPKPPKKPNTEILEHEQKRQIEIQLIGLRAALEKEDNTPEEIEEKVRRVRVHLHSKLAEAPIITQNTSHSKIFQKTEEISRFQTAFNIDKDYVIGSGFDFEAIEEKRVQEQENKRILYEKNKLLAEIKLKQAAAEPAKVVPELELGEIVDSSVNLDIKEDLPKDLQTLKTPNPAKNPTIEREKNEEKKEEIKVDLKHSSEAGEISERSPQRDRSLRKEGNERSQRDKDYSRDRRDQRPHGERDYKYRKDHRDQRDPISRRENADESGKKYSKDQSDRRDRADNEFALEMIEAIKPERIQALIKTTKGEMRPKSMPHLLQRLRFRRRIQVLIYRLRSSRNTEKAQVRVRVLQIIQEAQAVGLQVLGNAGIIDLEVLEGLIAETIDIVQDPNF